jgi:hypothetical protein
VGKGAETLVRLGLWIARHEPDSHLHRRKNMKTAIVAGLIAMALATTAAGCMSRMHGRMMDGMMRNQASSAEGSGSASDKMGMHRQGMMSSMMECCNEQCPIMKGKAGKTQPS